MDLSELPIDETDNYGIIRIGSLSVSKKSRNINIDITNESSKNYSKLRNIYSNNSINIKNTCLRKYIYVYGENINIIGNDKTLKISGTNLKIENNNGKLNITNIDTKESAYETIIYNLNSLDINFDDYSDSVTSFTSSSNSDSESYIKKSKENDSEIELFSMNNILDNKEKHMNDKDIIVINNQPVKKWKRFFCCIFSKKH